MALPVILFNSSTGSDTAASGAGPATALHGASNASTDATGTVVTLGGSPNLSGVATDGSASLWLATASGRQWSAISAVDNTAKTVTVTTAYTGSLSSQSWAIGGRRKSLAGSLKLLQADRIYGWIIELDGGYEETLSAVIDLSTAGIYYFNHLIRAAPGTTEEFRPRFTITNGSTAFSAFFFSQSYNTLQGIDIYTDYVPTSGVDFNRAIDIFAQVQGITLNDVRIINGGSGGFLQGIFMNAGGSGTCSSLKMIQCQVNDPSGTMVNGGILHTNAGGAYGPPYETVLQIFGCDFNGISGNAINLANGTFISSSVHNCLFDGCGSGMSINLSADSPSTNNRGGFSVCNNTFVGCSSHGMSVSGGSNSWQNFICQNNIFASNGGYGIYQDSSAAGFLNNAYPFTGGNLFYNNTSGTNNISQGMPNATTAVDPAFRDDSSRDYTPGAAATGLTDPTWDIGAVRGYANPGAIQRKAAAIRRGIMTGGRM